MYTVGDVVEFLIEEECNVNVVHIGEIVVSVHSGNREAYYHIKDYKTGVYYCEVKERHILKNKEEEKQMKKSDLKNRMVVEIRNGDKYLVVDDYLLAVNGDNFMMISSYTDDLMDKDKSTDPMEEEINREFDIMKVYDRTVQWKHFREKDLIWERKEVVTMTLSDIKKKLGVDNLQIIF